MLELIRCRSCGRIWPRGTRYCGICRAGLGCRYCPDGHESPLDAQICVQCGSPSLTKGVPASRLEGRFRFAVTAAALALAAAFVPVILSAAASFACLCVARAVPLLILATAANFTARKVLGDRAVDSLQSGLGWAASAIFSALKGAVSALTGQKSLP